MNKIEILRKKISQAQQIVISSHVGPDGDAIGSSLGLWHYLQTLGKKAYIIVPNEFPNFLKWLPNSADIIVFDAEEEKAKELTANADLMFCLDYNEPHRTAQYSETLSQAKAYKVLIDHHIGNPTWQDLNLSVVGASSTCELVYHTIVKLAGAEVIDKNMAQSLYTGLLTDTGNFQYQATTAEVHRIAGHLIEKGVQPNIIHDHINNSYDENRLKFFGFCISKKMNIIAEKEVAYVMVSSNEMKKYNIGVGGTEGLVNEPMKISNIKVSILCKQDQGKIKMSFRSKGDIDVSKFASTYFEGGGHKNASGGVSYLTMEETKKKLELLIPSYF